MMATCSGNLERTLGTFLAAHLREAFEMGCRDNLAGAGGFERGAFGQMGDEPRQIGGGVNGRGPDPSGLGPAALGAVEHAPILARRKGRGQRADDRNQAAIERQFTQRHRLFDLFTRDDVERCQKRQRDGQVEMRSFLWQIGG